MRKRLIPILLLDSRRRLVKTVQFGLRTYIGDPFNVIRILNEKEVDEVCLLDIDATRNSRSPDTGFISEVAKECFMPLAYGGGLSTAKQCDVLNRAGIDKFVIGTGAENRTFITELANIFGSQAIVGCVDVKMNNGAHQCVTYGGLSPLPETPEVYARQLQEAGAGEILLQSIDRDGLRCGYDKDLIRSVSRLLTVPLIAAGGAGVLEHLSEGLAAGASAAASGSAFCFIGRLRAVLITYPTELEFDRLRDFSND
jgi:imidazole glycerol-phosphate synthase subunit HisF